MGDELWWGRGGAGENCREGDDGFGRGGWGEDLWGRHGGVVMRWRLLFVVIRGGFEVCQAGTVVLVVGWMTDVGSVDPAFKPRSLAIDGFTDLQYIKSRAHVTFRR